MILLIDNYDSFTYNLYQLIASLYPDVKVVRNDAISMDAIHALNPSAIVLSPGPGHPEEAGICIEVIRAFAPTIPVLGVCLGHQAIGVAFGGKVMAAPTLEHGKKSLIFHRRSGLFKDVQLPFEAGRYHSLVLDPQLLPACLTVLAQDSSEVIMAIKHNEFACYGIQFHPESILTAQGDLLIRNFIQEVKP